MRYHFHQTSSIFSSPGCDLCLVATGVTGLLLPLACQLIWLSGMWNGGEGGGGDPVHSSSESLFCGFPNAELTRLARPPDAINWREGTFCPQVFFTDKYCKRAKRESSFVEIVSPVCSVEASLGYLKTMRPALALA